MDDPLCCRPYRHRSNEPTTNSEKWNEKPRLVCVNVRHPPSKTYVGVYSPLHAGVKCKWNDRAVRLAGKATITGGLLPGRSEVLRSLRHNPLRPQSQRHRTIDRLEERGYRKRKRSTILIERTRKRHRQSDQNIETVSRAALDWGQSRETVWSAYGPSRMHKYHLELNWTEPHPVYSCLFVFSSRKRKKAFQFRLFRHGRVCHPHSVHWTRATTSTSTGSRFLPTTSWKAMLASMLR